MSVESVLDAAFKVICRSLTRFTKEFNMRRLISDYRLWMRSIAIASVALVSIPGMAHAQCASGGGMGRGGGGGGGTGAATTSGTELQFGGSNSQMAFAMQLMQMQQQAQMQEMMRRQMMSDGEGSCMGSQTSQALTSRFSATSSTAQTRSASTPPARPLTDIQRRRIEMEEARQLEIQAKIAERERQTAERIAAHEQRLAELRARHEAN
jgi:hypothetical protein